VEIKLRDNKYDLALLGVHGASYREQGSDPVLQLVSESLVLIEERSPIHTAPIEVQDRQTSHVECYGGIEELEELRNIFVPTPIQPGRIVFPKAKGAGGTNLPIIIPIARLAAKQAAVVMVAYKGDVPQEPVAVASNVEVFIDWEMSHGSHKLLFDTPAFHIGVRGQWAAGQKRSKRSGLWLEFHTGRREVFLKALRLVIAFDDFIRQWLQLCFAKPYNDTLQLGEDIYTEIDGPRMFAHEFRHPSFQAVLPHIHERVQAQPGLQTYYGVG
jgi:hypothetical protein